MYPISRDFPLPVSVTIKNGAALSDAIDLRRFPSACYTTPAAWTAASLGFKVSLDGVNYFPLKLGADTLIEHTMNTTPSRGSAFPADVYAFAFVKLWSETTGANVNQTADRVFLVGTKS